MGVLREPPHLLPQPPVEESECGTGQPGARVKSGASGGLEEELVPSLKGGWTKKDCPFGPQHFHRPLHSLLPQSPAKSGGGWGEDERKQVLSPRTQALRGGSWTPQQRKARALDPAEGTHRPGN